MSDEKEKARDQNEQLIKELWDADPNCVHEIETLWSGIKCKKCNGWCCL